MLILLFTVAREITPVNYTLQPMSGWQHDEIVLVGLLCHVSISVSNFLIRSTISQSISYPIMLTRLGEPHSIPNPLLKL